MRLIKQIPHDHYMIQIHQYNGKYILQISLGQFEQSFKLDVADVMNVDDLENAINAEFLSKCLRRFVEMREDWTAVYAKINA